MAKGEGEGETRETQLLALAASGLSDKEIALRLGIRLSTVDSYWRRIRQRFETSSRTEAVARALQASQESRLKEDREEKDRLLYEMARRTQAEQALLKCLEAMNAGDLTFLLEGSLDEHATGVVTELLAQLRYLTEGSARMSHEIGVLGVLGGQLETESLRGTWRELAESMNRMSANLTTQIRDITRSLDAVNSAAIPRPVTAQASGEFLALKETVNDLWKHPPA